MRSHKDDMVKFDSHISHFNIPQIKSTRRSTIKSSSSSYIDNDDIFNHAKRYTNTLYGSYVYISRSFIYMRLDDRASRIGNYVSPQIEHHHHLMVIHIVCVFFWPIATRTYIYIYTVFIMWICDMWCVFNPSTIPFVPGIRLRFMDLYII